ncbi:hypothetical protein [Rhodopirellula halodulae]|nr:hypothetical protein [Rhodopirellula sp. JC737]
MLSIFRVLRALMMKHNATSQTEYLASVSPTMFPSLSRNPV